MRRSGHLGCVSCWVSVVSGCGSAWQHPRSFGGDHRSPYPSETISLPDWGRSYIFGRRPIRRDPKPRSSPPFWGSIWKEDISGWSKTDNPCPKLGWHSPKVLIGNSIIVIPRGPQKHCPVSLSYVPCPTRSIHHITREYTSWAEAMTKCAPIGCCLRFGTTVPLANATSSVRVIFQDSPRKLVRPIQTDRALWLTIRTCGPRCNGVPPVLRNGRTRSQISPSCRRCSDHTNSGGHLRHPSFGRWRSTWHTKDTASTGCARRRDHATTVATSGRCCRLRVGLPPGGPSCVGWVWIDQWAIWHSLKSRSTKASGSAFK